MRIPQACEGFLQSSGQVVAVAEFVHESVAINVGPAVHKDAILGIQLPDEIPAPVVVVHHRAGRMLAAGEKRPRPRENVALPFLPGAATTCRTRNTVKPAKARSTSKLIARVRDADPGQRRASITGRRPIPAARPGPVPQRTGTMTSTRIGICRMERSAAGIVASRSRRLRSRGQRGSHAPGPRQRQQHEQQRQVSGIVEVRRKPLLDEAVHRCRAQSLKRVPVKSDAIRIHCHQRQAECERRRQLLKPRPRISATVPDQSPIPTPSPSKKNAMKASPMG